MTTLYIAGPMRGIPEFNFPAFLGAQKDLELSGFGVINPAARDIEDGFDYEGLTGHEDLAVIGFDLRAALAWDLHAIAVDSDGIATLEGWENSKGASAEVATAKALGLPVKPLEDWLIQAHINVVDEHVKALAETYAWPTYFIPQGTTEDGDEVLTTADVLRANTVTMPDVLPTGEVRVTSETGGQKGRKAAELATLDPLALEVLAKVSGFGARKYESFNYLKGYDWSLSANAAFRHLLSFLQGEDNDPESGLPHTAHFAWHGLALTSFLVRELGTDDRVSAMLARHREEVAA